jgi:hypothetical protein
MPENKKEEEIQVIEDLEKKEPEKGLEIQLNDDGEPKTDEQKKKDDEDAKIKEQEVHKKNQEAASRRIDREKADLKKKLEDRDREISELRKPRVSNSFGNTNPYNPVVKDKRYWETRLAEDPVTALDEYEEHKYQIRLRQQQEASERESLVGSFYKSLEDSKEIVYEEFPELKNEDSEHYSMFMSILEKHPEWRNSPIGPIKVANEMKRALKSGNGDNIISKARSDGANEERDRQARINNQPLSSGRDTGSKKSFTLTKAQLELCKEMNIKPENYAKIAMRMNNGEGVSV